MSTTKNLTTSVRLQTKDAVASLDRLERKIRHIENTINKVSNNESNLTRNINKSTTAQNNLTNATRRHERAVDGVNAKQQKQNSLLDSAVRKAKQLAGAYLGVMGARALINTSDTITGAHNKLNYMNGNDTQATKNSMDKMYNSAQKVRMGYTDMMANVSKSMVLAEKAFDGNIDNAIRFQEIMSEAYTIGGASAAEMSSSMYQMIQALGSGILQGDELRSVREGAPLAYKAIEQFAQGVYDTDESLKELASQGKITSEMVVAAMLNAGKGIDEAFANTDMTFAQLWNNMKNTAVKAFEPVFATMNKLVNSTEMQKALEIITNGLVIVAQVLSVVINAFAAFFKWFVNNWYWIRWIVYAVITALIIALGIMVAKAIWAGIQMFISFLMGLSPLYLIILLIGVVVAAIVWLANTVGSASQFIFWSLMIVAAAILLIGIITGSVTMIIIAVVIAAIAIILYAFMEFGSQIVGGIYWIGAVFANIGMAIANCFIACWSWVLAGFYNMGAFICNYAIAIWNTLRAIGTNIGIAFQNAWTWAKNSFWEFIADVLTGVSKLEPVINGIAKLIGKGGVDFGGLISSARGKQSDYKSFVSVGDAFSSGMHTFSYKNMFDAVSNGLNTFEYKNLGDAYDKGAKIGANWQNKLNSAASTVKDKISGFSSMSLSEMLTGKDVNLGNFGADANNLNTTINPDDIANALGKGSDPTGSGKTGTGKGSGDPSKTLKDIADDTDAISDAVALSSEDLEYLRKIAAMEWKKEYTTASITVDMKNYNTIDGDSDLDGIVTKLTQKLYDELDSLANGVYA